jgi:hypothetical protein
LCIAHAEGWFYCHFCRFSFWSGGSSAFSFLFLQPKLVEIGAIFPVFSNKLEVYSILVVGNVFLNIASVGGTVTDVFDIDISF